MPLPLLIANYILMGIYAGAALCCLIFRKQLGWRRIIPLIAPLSIFMPYLTRYLRHQPAMHGFIQLFTLMIEPAAIYFTVRLTWHGKHWIDQTLCVVSIVFGGEFIYTMMTGIP